MSLLTQAYVLDKYGPRLNSDQIAEVLGITKVAVMNQHSNGVLGLKTYKDSGKLWADYRDVATFFDSVREAAA
jgi:hypothetical protein